MPAFAAADLVDRLHLLDHGAWWALDAARQP